MKKYKKVYTASIRLKNGKKIYAKDYNKKAFVFLV